MKSDARLQHIVHLIDKHGYLSVRQLSELCDTSLITIRRDLGQLQAQNRVRRTHGGAATLRQQNSAQDQNNGLPVEQVFSRIDALVTSDILPRYTSLLPAGGPKRRIPIIAESLAFQDSETSVQVDNYQAGLALGRWAGQYALDHWGGRACLLDLTYHRTNTQDRSRGFLDGLGAVTPAAELRLSINAQSRYDMAYQLTRDALSVHSDINIIFAVNDTNAYGAYKACLDQGIAPDQLIILSFGVEGPTMLELITQGKWCAAGLCMFPEIVAITCVEAAIAAYNNQPLTPVLYTPFCIATHENLSDFYARSGQGWQIQWAKISCDLDLPLPFDIQHPNRSRPLPKRMAFIYTFIDHEWYQSLAQTMKAYTDSLDVRLDIVDFENTLRDELALRRVEIARLAAKEVKPGDKIFIDGGAITFELAEQLNSHRNITVITNSLPVLEALKDNNYITLISTGGALRRSSQAFVGPTAEAAIQDFRIDKLFLTVSGISDSFGLSHTDISEVTIKQHMIHSSREVILLADHSSFQHEALAQVAPVSVVHKIITDDALPASVRLELGKIGIQVILAT